jgi:uncharacterized protein involved in exopolysaccharide biosynthesis
MPNIGKQLLGLTLLLFGLALGGTGLWLLLSPAQYAATAKVRIEFDANTLPSNQTPPSGMAYDPYFIQITYELIQSPLLLSNVVMQLNLNENWGKKYSNREPLKTSTSIEIVRQYLRLAPVRNTKLLSITFTSHDPNEAADVANSVAKSYCDYRNQLNQEAAKKGLAVLPALYLEEEKRIQASETSLSILREQYGVDPSKEALWEQPIITPSKESSASEQAAAKGEYERAKPFWDAKRDLIQKLKYHRLLAAKIEMVKLDVDNPKQFLVQITDRANPPQKPIWPNRFLGLTLALAGLASLLTGFILLKSSSHRPA